MGKYIFFFFAVQENERGNFETGMGKERLGWAGLLRLDFWGWVMGSDGDLLRCDSSASFLSLHE